MAVGILGEGQNLNFAVPASYAQSLLDQKPDTAIAVKDVSQSLSEARALVQKRKNEEYSADTSSPYQQDTSQLLSVVRELSAKPNRVDVLKELACFGTVAYVLSDYGIKAARDLVKANPSPENRALLSYMLLDRAQDEDLTADFSSDGSPEKASAKLAHDQYLTEASIEANEAENLSKSNHPLVADYVLGSAATQRRQFADAIAPLTRVANGQATVCGDDLAESAYRSLIADTNRMGSAGESEKWFRRYASLYEPPPYQWDLEGDRRDSAHDYATSADAYERAAKGSTYYAYDFCYAAAERYFEEKTDADAVLSDGRSCIDASVKETNKENQSYLPRTTPCIIDSWRLC